MPCRHENREVEGQRKEKTKSGAVKVVRSYRCLDCGEVLSDTGTAQAVRTRKESRKSAAAPAEPAEAVPELGLLDEEDEMADEKKNGKSKPEKKAAKPKVTKEEKAQAKFMGRVERSLARGEWEMGKLYKQTVKRRSDGKEFECKMLVTKSGFKDQEGKTWSSPTALTVNFAVKVVGQAKGTRRTAANFFGIDIPKKLQNENLGPGKGKGKEKKPAKTKVAPKAAAKPKAKAAAKKAPAKAPAKPAAKAPAKPAAKSAPAKQTSPKPKAEEPEAEESEAEGETDPDESADAPPDLDI